MKITHLGPIFVVPAFPVAYSALETICAIKSVVSIKNKRRKHKNHSPRAQTTRLVSFGPVFVVPALLVTYFIISTHIYI